MESLLLSRTGRGALKSEYFLHKLSTNSREPDYFMPYVELFNFLKRREGYGKALNAFIFFGGQIPAFSETLSVA